MSHVAVAGHGPDRAFTFDATIGVGADAVSHRPAFGDQFGAAEQLPNPPGSVARSLVLDVLQAADPRAAPSPAGDTAQGHLRRLPLCHPIKQVLDDMLVLGSRWLQPEQALLELKILDDRPDMSRQLVGMANEKADQLAPVRLMFEGFAETSCEYRLHKGRTATLTKDLAPPQGFFDRVVIGSVHEVMGHRLCQSQGNVCSSDVVAQAEVSEPPLLPMDLRARITEPHLVHEMGNGVGGQEMSSQTAKCPQPAPLGGLPCLGLSQPIGMPASQSEKPIQESERWSPRRAAAEGYGAQEIRAVLDLDQETLERTSDPRISARLGEGLVDSGIDALLGAVLAQGIVAYHKHKAGLAVREKGRHEPGWPQCTIPVGLERRSPSSACPSDEMARNEDAGTHGLALGEPKEGGDCLSERTRPRRRGSGAAVESPIRHGG